LGYDIFCLGYGIFDFDSVEFLDYSFFLQVYFPIVFSEYSPETWSDNDRLMVDAFHYGRRRGYFRHFGFGLVSLYKSDLDIVGGLATNIHGWGLEDVDLVRECEKMIGLIIER